MSDPRDLSGEWTGVYDYPRDLAPVPFTATLTESGGQLTGTVSEEDVTGAARRRRQAFVEGRRDGAAVTWLKSYEQRDVECDVAYEGEVSADGREIRGQWRIVGDWSGAFVMMRRAAPAANETEGTAEEEF